MDHDTIHETVTCAAPEENPPSVEIFDSSKSFQEALGPGVPYLTIPNDKQALHQTVAMNIDRPRILLCTRVGTFADMPTADVTQTVAFVSQQHVSPESFLAHFAHTQVLQEQQEQQQQQQELVPQKMHSHRPRVRLAVPSEQEEEEARELVQSSDAQQDAAVAQTHEDMPDGMEEAVESMEKEEEEVREPAQSSDAQPHKAMLDDLEAKMNEMEKAMKMEEEEMVVAMEEV